MDLRRAIILGSFHFESGDIPLRQLDDRCGAGYYSGRCLEFVGPALFVCQIIRGHGRGWPGPAIIPRKGIGAFRATPRRLFPARAAAVASGHLQPRLATGSPQLAPADGV